MRHGVVARLSRRGGFSMRAGWPLLGEVQIIRRAPQAPRKLLAARTRRTRPKRRDLAERFCEPALAPRCAVETRRGPIRTGRRRPLAASSCNDRVLRRLISRTTSSARRDPREQRAGRSARAAAMATLSAPVDMLGPGQRPASISELRERGQDDCFYWSQEGCLRSAYPAVTSRVTPRAGQRIWRRVSSPQPGSRSARRQRRGSLCGSG